MFHSSKRWRKQHNRKRPGNRRNTKHTKANFKGIANYAVQYSLSGRRITLTACLCVRFEFTATFFVPILKKLFLISSDFEHVRSFLLQFYPSSGVQRNSHFS